MAYLTKKLEKLEKQLKTFESKKASKRCVQDSSSNSWDNNQDSGYTSPSIHFDKRFKLDKPSGIDLTSCDTGPIKATRTALDITKANEKAVENSKTGKVAAVVAIIKMFEKRVVCQNVVTLRI